jgi:hypothetical protein
VFDVVEAKLKVLRMPSRIVIALLVLLPNQLCAAVIAPTSPVRFRMVVLRISQLRLVFKYANKPRLPL